MRKPGIIIALGIMLAAILTALGPQSATAAPVAPTAAAVDERPTPTLQSRSRERRAGCGDTYSKFGGTLAKDIGMGGVHSWRVEARAQDCDGYDRVAGIIVTLEKQNGRCSNGALSHINNYDFNPNVLGGWNAGTRTIDCKSGQEVYNIGFLPGEWIILRSSMTESNRCIGAKVQVDLGPVLSDYNGTTPSVCFNGA